MLFRTMRTQLRSRGPSASSIATHGSGQLDLRGFLRQYALAVFQALWPSASKAPSRVVGWLRSVP